MKCAICKGPATKKVLWADGRAYQPSCEKDVNKVKAMLKRKNGNMAEVIEGVQDLSDTLDLVSAAYPSLERKPGGPDNWVERAGGLPKYIERIAKRLHYERGYTISRAIATAVNTVKRWARMGKVAKYGDPNKKHVTAKTAAQAAAAVAQWNAKRKAGSLNLSDVEEFIIERTRLSDEFCLELAEEIEGIDLTMYDQMGTGADESLHAILSSMDIKDMALRANAIADPEARGAARQRVLDLAGVDAAEVIDLASTIAPRNARGRATDGRKSFKGQGKWKHGHIPLNRAAKEAKAKGSPIAMKRMDRLFGSDKAKDDARKSTREVQSTKTSGKTSGFRKQDAKQVKVSDKGVNERSTSVGSLRNTKFVDRVETKHSSPKNRKEASKQSRAPRRAEQPWDEIPENLKTVRNGKRYVLATFGGRQTITEHTGGVNEQDQGPLAKRKVMTSITTADAMNMSTTDLRRMLKNGNTPPSVKKILNRALIKKDPEAKG